MKSIKILILVILGLLNTQSFGQQIPLVDHYYLNPYLSNPAAAGDNGTNLFGIYRTQWVDVEGAPETFLITLDGDIQSKNIGLGFTMYNDIVNIVGKTGAMGTYSYKIPLAKEQKLSFGLSLGVEQNKLLFDRLETENPMELTLVNNVKQNVNFDANFGIHYTAKNLKIGLAGYQLLANQNVFSDNLNFEDYRFSFLRHFLATASYDIPLSEKLSAQPFVQARFAQDIDPQIDLAAILNYNKTFWLGAGFRNGFGVNFKVGASIADKFTFGYSHGFSTGDVTKLSATSHEVLLGLKLGNGSGSKSDKDKDGVSDMLDSEPLTPHWQHVHADEPYTDASECIVDQRGIALDSDFDKVPDCVDKEVNSIVGAPVDEDGVALDTDKDGVPDMFDREEETPEGCEVDKMGVALDEDKDGVPNCFDNQLNSPFGAPVDPDGVALDTDLDKVPDFFDFEPETPHWEHINASTPSKDASKCIVDKKGIAKDTDKDGVPDCVDMELESPRNVLVDSRGVALDSDNDGVPDGLDVEPDSPQGCVVDKWGRCGKAVNSPNDADGDGVPDNLDLQANTPEGTPVDDWGRALVDETPKVKSDPFSNRLDVDEMVDYDDYWDYYVVVGVFKYWDNVQRYQKHLVKHYSENTKILTTKEGYYYVWTKIVVTQDEARTEIARLTAKNIEEYIVGNPWLWREPK